MGIEFVKFDVKLGDKTKVNWQLSSTEKEVERGEKSRLDDDGGSHLHVS